MTVQLVPMRWWHIERLEPIELELFGAERWPAATFWSELAEASTRYYRVLADGPGPDDGDIVGYGGLCTYGDESWVQNIAVTGSRQGQGLGALLLDDLLAEAARRRSVHVALEVRADNVRAQRLYARRGFEQVAIRRGYYQPSNTDALVMVREENGSA
ncbi:MAG: [ribosomal protein S18]-alanine N-acetyltransferase [Cryptosporangiaceae bacterium]|nr:[ribosomal protein S18]-alanine N-acetyltransferase [Cryptosporangiaceae bacterium]